MYEREQSLKRIEVRIRTAEEVETDGVVDGRGQEVHEEELEHVL